jgi:hypothetical protein
VRWTEARTAEHLETWRKEDAELAKLPLERLSVGAYVLRPGVAPFFKQQPVIEGGKADPKESPETFAM